MATISNGGWDEKQIIPISALEHFLYCPRQCALIHNEGIFTDNVLTIAGKLDHDRVDRINRFYEHNVMKETSFWVFSECYGITGIVDVIEFHSDGNIYPIDHKHGRKILWEEAAVQLCAYVLCLEEMFGTIIYKGAVYHTSSKKRSEVVMDSSLREKTKRAIIATRELLVLEFLPPPRYGTICKNCSLKNECMPQVTNTNRHKNIYKVEDYG